MNTWFTLLSRLAWLSSCSLLTLTLQSWSPVYCCPPPVLQNLIHEGHYREALDYLGDNKAGRPIDPWLNFQRAEIFRTNLKDNKSALVEINKALKVNPSEENFLALRAEIEQDLKQHKRALRDYSAAIAVTSSQCTHILLSQHKYKYSELRPACESEVRLLEKREKVRLNLGDHVGARADQRLLKTLKRKHDEFAKMEQEINMLQVASGKKLHSFLESEDPFCSSSLQNLTEKGIPADSNYGARVGYLQLGVATLNSKEVMAFVSAHELDHKRYPGLYKYPWGFLELTGNAQSGRIESLVLLQPIHQFFRITYNSAKKMSKQDDIELSTQILGMMRNDAPYSYRPIIISHLVELNEYDKALSFCAPDDFRARAGICYKAARYPEALRNITMQNLPKPDLDSSLQNEPQDRELLVKILIAMKRYNEASNIALEFHDRYGGEKYFLRAQIRQAFNDYSGAIQDLKEAKHQYFESAQIKKRDEASKLLDELEDRQKHQTASNSGFSCDGGDILVVGRSRSQTSLIENLYAH